MCRALIIGLLASEWLMDASFLERLLQVDAYAVSIEKIKLIQDEIISQGDWDIFRPARLSRRLRRSASGSRASVCSAEEIGT